MSSYFSTAKATLGVTHEEPRDIFTVPDEFLHNLHARKKEELRRQDGRLGTALEMQ